MHDTQKVKHLRRLGAQILALAAASGVTDVDAITLSLARMSDGDLTARIEAEYELLLTQRLILQPRVELELSAQDIPELEIGAGVSGLDAGLRQGPGHITDSQFDEFFVRVLCLKFIGPSSDFRKKIRRLQLQVVFVDSDHGGAPFLA